MRSNGGIWKGRGLGSENGFFAMVDGSVAAAGVLVAVFDAGPADAPLPSTEAQAASTSEERTTRRAEVTDAP
jgi:hypothetical protein